MYNIFFIIVHVPQSNIIYHLNKMINLQKNMCVLYMNINCTSQLRCCQYNQQFPLIKFLQKFVLFNQNDNSFSQELEIKYKA